jgi:hypothetical protein
VPTRTFNGYHDSMTRRFILLIVLVLAACSPTTFTHDVPNLAQVDANIWRSGQNTSQAGWNWITQIAAGRKVHVIKLNFDAEGSDTIAQKMGFDVLYVPVQPEGDVSIWDDLIDTWKSPDPVTIGKAEDQLAYCLAHSTTDVCLVHCTHGQDRTGLIIGEHRVLHDRWTKDAAYTEMLDHHFHPELHGVHETWESFKAP